MNDWQKIFVSDSPFKTDLAKAYLVEEHQIEAVVINKRDSSYLLGVCELYVPASRATLARFLLENEGGFEDLLQ